MKGEGCWRCTGGWLVLWLRVQQVNRWGHSCGLACSVLSAQMMRVPVGGGGDQRASWMLSLFPYHTVPAGRLTWGDSQSHAPSPLSAHSSASTNVEVHFWFIGMSSALTHQLHGVRSEVTQGFYNFLFMATTVFFDDYANISQYSLSLHFCNINVDICTTTCFQHSLENEWIFMHSSQNIICLNYSVSWGDALLSQSKRVYGF